MTENKYPYVNEGQLGLTIGVLAAAMHLGWALLVALGFAQALLNWLYGLHFLNNPFTVQAFDAVSAAILVAVTFVGGYLMGWVFAAVWNRIAK